MKLRTHIRVDKSILSTSGIIKYRRYILIPSDKASAEKLDSLSISKTIAPLDEMLQINNLPFKMTVSMMLEVAWYGVKCSSYEEATEMIKKRFNFDVNSSTVREVTNYVGKIIYLEDCRRARRAHWEIENCQVSTKKNEQDVLYLMMDGASLNTRQKVKMSDGQYSSWKENKLCVAFRKRNVRIRNVVTKYGNIEQRHEILKREYCSYTGSVDDFKWHVMALALRNGYGKVSECVIISDGAIWIKKLREELFPDAVHILDLYHLKENVYTYANAVYSINKDEAESWAKETCEQLENGEWKTVLKMLEQFNNKVMPENTVNLTTYIDHHKEMINYPAYKNAGYFVGSGMIESGNKIVLQKRLKGPGMRWNVPTARYVLSLRSKIESSLWESDVVSFIRNRMIVLKDIPPRLPRGEKIIEEIEAEDIRKASEEEKRTWKKKRK